MFRLIRIALGLFLMLLISPGSVRAQMLGLGNVGRLVANTGRRTRPGYGALLHGSRHLQRKDGDRGFDQPGHLDPVERLYAIRPTWKPPAETCNGAARTPPIIGPRTTQLSRRIRDNPTARDIEMGDAINAAVDQLTDPQDFQLCLADRLDPGRGERHRGYSVSQRVRGGDDRAFSDESRDQVAGRARGRPLRGRQEGVRGTRRQGDQGRRRGRHLSRYAQAGPRFHQRTSRQARRRAARGNQGARRRFQVRQDVRGPGPAAGKA